MNLAAADGSTPMHMAAASGRDEAAWALLVGAAHGPAGWLPNQTEGFC